MFVFSNLHAPHAELVYCGGKLVAQDGRTIAKIAPAPTATLPPAMNIRWDSVNFDIPATSRHIRVIGTVHGQVVTENRTEEAKIENGKAVADLSRDLLKIAVIERHHATGNIGKGFIQGIGLKRGAIAGTVAHDHHNLVVVGADDISMMTAVKAVAQSGGGLVAVNGEQVLAELPLPVAGLMSDRPLEEVRAALDHLIDVTTRELGSPLHDPFMLMGFMALEVIPSLKLTDLGLVDVDQFKPVELFV
jgi:adenine deaminase